MAKSDNMRIPRFKVGDFITWRDGRYPGQGNKDYGQIVGVTWGPLMQSPLYCTIRGTMVPEDAIIAPKLTYDRYEVGVLSVLCVDNEFLVSARLHFRSGHGNSEEDVSALLGKILEEHCEHN